MRSINAERTGWRVAGLALVSVRMTPMAGQEPGRVLLPDVRHERPPAPRLRAAEPEPAAVAFSLDAARCRSIEGHQCHTGSRPGPRRIAVQFSVHRPPAAIVGLGEIFKPRQSFLAERPSGVTAIDGTTKGLRRASPDTLPRDGPIRD